MLLFSDDFGFFCDAPAGFLARRIRGKNGLQPLPVAELE